MEKHKQSSNGVKDADTQELRTPPLDLVEKWLENDLGRAISLLHAIYNDPNIKRLVAVHLHGLAMNFNNAKQSVSKVEEN